jgi:hypothetical protein
MIKNLNLFVNRYSRGMQILAIQIVDVSTNQAILNTPVTSSYA